MTSAAPHTPQKSLELANLREHSYTVRDGWLERDGRQLLAGPVADLEHFADMMSLLDPPPVLVSPVLRVLMQGRRGSIFTVGEELRRLARRAAP
jgi:hypothetical protein